MNTHTTTMMRTAFAATALLALAAGADAAKGGVKGGGAPVMTRAMNTRAELPFPGAQVDAWDDYAPVEQVLRPVGNQIRTIGRDANPQITHIPNGQDPECDLPAHHTFTPDGNYLLVTNEATSNLSVLDSHTRAVVRVVALSDRPYDVAVAADGSYAVVTQPWANQMSFVDYATGVEEDVVAVGDMPTMAMISPDGSYVVIGNAVDESFTVIDAATRTVVRTLTGVGGAFGMGFAFSSAGGGYSWTYEPTVLPDNRLVVPDPDNQKVNFIDLATGTMTDVAVEPFGSIITSTPDGSKVVLLHNPVPDNLSLTVIETTTPAIDGRILASNSIYNGYTQLVMRPDGSKVAFFHGATATMIFNLEDYNEAPIQSYWYGYGLSTTADGAYLFINRTQCSSLLDWETGQPLFFSGPPEFCAPDEMDYIGSDLVVSSPSENRVAMLDVSDAESIVTFSLDGLSAYVEGVSPIAVDAEADRCRALAMTPDGSIGVGVNDITENATIFDLDNGVATGWIPVGAEPRGVAITPDGATALVTGTEDGSITVIDIATQATSTLADTGCTGPIVIDAAGAWAYVAAFDDGTGYGCVKRIDLSTVAIDPNPVYLTATAGVMEVRTFGLFLDNSWGKVQELAISHDGAALCVCGAAEVTMVDLATWANDVTIDLSATVSSPITAARFAPDDSALYVLGYHVMSMDTNHLFTISNAGPASAVTHTLPNCGVAGVDLAINDAGDTLHIACRGGGPAETKALVTVDLTTNTVVNSLEMPQPEGNGFQDPHQVAYNGDESVLYVLGSDGWLHLVDPATLTINESIDTGAYSGYGFALDNDIERLAIITPHEYIDGVTVVDFGAPACPWDTAPDGAPDGTVGLGDLNALLSNWGPCPAPPAACPWDFAPEGGDGTIGLGDLNALLSNWGPCP
jgi:YVTN family beta-propeller protein